MFTRVVWCAKKRKIFFNLGIIMKRLISLNILLAVNLFLGLFVSFSLPAFDAQIRADAVFHNTSRFTDVYDRVNASWGVEVSDTFFDIPNTEIWSNFDMLVTSKSHSGFCACKSKIYVPSFGLGLKTIFLTTNAAKFYLGVGPAFSVVTIKNRSCFTNEKITRDCWGALFKLGAKYEFSSDLFLDAFIDYQYLSVNFHHTVEVGGLKIGLGLGSSF